MSRDSRNRSGYGSSFISTPRVKDPTIQKALDAIFKEINQLKISTSSLPNKDSSLPGEGSKGDIRLYEGNAPDGTAGYFLQGKFGDSWATVQLDLQKDDPSQVDVSSDVPTYENTPITTSDVTFEALDNNNDIGMQSNQVPKGDHTHSHLLLTQIGSNSHDDIDTHIADESIHAEPQTEANLNATVSNVSTVGLSDKWAREDHGHILDRTVSYSWTNKHILTHNDDSDVAFTLTNTGTAKALEVTGDVKITGDTQFIGDISVDFASAGGGNADIDAGLTVDENVVLNEDLTEAYTTTIHGKTYINDLLEVTEALTGGERGQIKLSSDASNDVFLACDSSGNFIIESKGPTATLRTDYDSVGGDKAFVPHTSGAYDLGTNDLSWRTLFVNELYAEQFQVQDVVATSGGRILVARSSNLASDISSGAADGLTIEMPDFIAVPGDFLIMKKADPTQAGGGEPVIQTEVFEILTYTGYSGGNNIYTANRDIDGSGANNWLEGDAVVNLGGGEGSGYIDITSGASLTGGHGPSLTIHARDDSTQTWDSANLVSKFGNLNGVFGNSSTNFGLAAGKNLDKTATDVSNPFQGIVVDETNGLQIVNSPMKLYDGNSLSAFIGKDSEGFDVFALGEGLSNTATSTGEPDTWSNSKLLFKKTSSSGNYQLEMSGDVLLNNPDEWPFYDNSDDILDDIDFMQPNADNPSSDGFMLTSSWLGFYKGGETVDWPIKIGAVGDNQFAYIGAEDESSYLKYTTDSGLEVKGSITVTGEQSEWSRMKDIQGGVINVPYDQSGAVKYIQSTVGATKIRFNFKIKGPVDGNWALTWSPYYINNENPSILVGDVLTQSGSADDFVEYEVILEGPDLTNSQGITLVSGWDQSTNVNSYYQASSTKEHLNSMIYIEGSELSFRRDMDPSEDNDLLGSRLQLINLDWTPSGGANADPVCELHDLSVSVDTSSIYANNYEEVFDSGVHITYEGIEIGNTVGSRIRTKGKDTFTDDTAGFWLGRDTDSLFKFNLGDEDNFLKWHGDRLELGVGSISFRIEEDIPDQGGDNDYKDIFIGSWSAQTNEDVAFNIDSGDGLLIKHGANDWTSISSSGIARRDYVYPVEIYDGHHAGLATRFHPNQYNSTFNIESTMHNTPANTWGFTDDYDLLQDDNVVRGWGDLWRDDNAGHYDLDQNGQAESSRTGYFQMGSANYGTSYGMGQDGPWGFDENGLKLNSDGTQGWIVNGQGTPLYSDIYFGARDFYKGQKGFKSAEGVTIAGQGDLGDTAAVEAYQGRRQCNFRWESPNANDKRIGGIRNAYRLHQPTHSYPGMFDSRNTHTFPWNMNPLEYNVGGSHVGYFLCKEFKAGGKYPNVVPPGRKLRYEISGSEHPDTCFLLNNGMVGYSSILFGQLSWGGAVFSMMYSCFKNGEFLKTNVLDELTYLFAGWINGPQGQEGATVGLQTDQFLYSTKRSNSVSDTTSYNIDGSIGVDQGEVYQDMMIGFNDDVNYRTFSNGWYYGNGLGPTWYGGWRDETCADNDGYTDGWTGVGDGFYDYNDSPELGALIPNFNWSWQGRNIISRQFKKHAQENTTVFSGEIPSGTDVRWLHYHGGFVFPARYIYIDFLGNEMLIPVLFGGTLVPRIKIWEVDDDV